MYILAAGARCEANTFDGERCLYAALNERIRRVLKTFKAITPECMRRDSYREWLRRLAYKLELMVYRVLIAAFCNSRILLLTVKF